MNDREKYSYNNQNFPTYMIQFSGFNYFLNSMINYFLIEKRNKILFRMGTHEQNKNEFANDLDNFDYV